VPSTAPSGGMAGNCSAEDMTILASRVQGRLACPVLGALGGNVRQQ
jgi:hypothetical protein